MLQRMIGEDIELVAQLDPELRHVLVDPSQIEQVVMNLVVNARDAMPQGGKLMIETANVYLDEMYARKYIGVKPGQHVMLAVSDTGIGMDAEILTHMFEPFFTTKGRDKGTGLGLATVYGIVKQSHGHLWVYSEVGEGSTFKVYLPAVETETEKTGLNQAPKEYRGTETIIVAEDDVSVRELAVAILEQQGYTVFAEENSQACLCRFFEYTVPPDLLLTDVVMPDLNGKALAQRAVEQVPGLKVLFMSGYTDNVIVKHGVLEKGAHFIQKPFTLQALAAKVREVLEN